MLVLVHKLTGIPLLGRTVSSNASFWPQRRQNLPICFSMSAASSGVALGRMPGSVKLVCSRVMTTNTKRTPAMAGMQLVRCLTRKGQLRQKRSYWRAERGSRGGYCDFNHRLNPQRSATLPLKTAIMIKQRFSIQLSSLVHSSHIKGCKDKAMRCLLVK